MLTFRRYPATLFRHQSGGISRGIVFAISPSYWIKLLVISGFVLLLTGSLSFTTSAQTDEAFGDSAADPVKLFERGQGAHARGDFEKALGFYDQAIAVRPEFPEAEFQRGNALASLLRFQEAEAAFRRAIALKKNWSLTYSALGALLMRRERDLEAAPIFRQALVVDPQDNVALRLLAEICLRAGETKEALELARRATINKEAPASAWIGLAVAQRANGNNAAARETLDHVLSAEPGNLAALMERADLLTAEKTYDSAITDLKSAVKLRPADKVIMSRLAYVYHQAGKTKEPMALAKAAGLEVQQSTSAGKTCVI